MSLLGAVSVCIRLPCLSGFDYHGRPPRHGNRPYVGELPHTMGEPWNHVRNAVAMRTISFYFRLFGCVSRIDFPKIFETFYFRSGLFAKPRRFSPIPPFFFVSAPVYRPGARFGRNSVLADCSVQTDPSCTGLPGLWPFRAYYGVRAAVFAGLRLPLVLYSPPRAMGDLFRTCFLQRRNLQSHHCIRYAFGGILNSMFIPLSVRNSRIRKTLR